jgi:hypothetical protein
MNTAAQTKTPAIPCAEADINQIESWRWGDGVVDAFERMLELESRSGEAVVESYITEIVVLFQSPVVAL